MSLPPLQAGMVASLAESEKQIAKAQAAARRQDKLAEERVTRAEEQIAALTQARQELDSKVSSHPGC